MAMVGIDADRATPADCGCFQSTTRRAGIAGGDAVTQDVTPALGVGARGGPVSFSYLV